MSFAAEETSVEQSQPIELYTIALGTATYTFTSCSNSITLAGTTYTPLEIKRDHILIGNEQRTQILTFTLPTASSFAQFYANNLPAQQAQITINRAQRLDNSNQIVLLFAGTVKSVSFSDKEGLATVGVMPISGNLTNKMLRYVYSSVCNHVLYDAQCTQVASNWQWTGITTNPVGNNVSVQGLAESTNTLTPFAVRGSGWATGGYMVHNGNYRLVTSQVGDLITLIQPFNESISGATVNVFAGCDHTLNTCNGKFANGINFFGFPYIPSINPFLSGLTGAGVS